MDQKTSNNDTINNINIDIGIEATTESLPRIIDTRSQLTNTSDELFKNLKGYITSEIELTLEDYKLLETMNNCTMEKFSQMTQISTDILNNIKILDKRYEEMSPKLEIIDKLDKKVTRIEKMAYAIDSYSKRLEKQYKLLEKGLNDSGPGPGPISGPGGFSQQSPSNNDTVE